MKDLFETSQPATLDLLKLSIPNFNMPEIKVPTNLNLASEFYDRLINWINDFHKSLEDDYEAGVKLVTFGQSVIFRIKEIGYWNPSLISFKGYAENGDPVELIQHITQISILLLKMKRQSPEEPKRPIGFGSWEEFEASKA